MNCELAKRLKDAGFPQNTNDLLNQVEYHGVKYTKLTEPTLSELIAACGESFAALERAKGWVAVAYITTDTDDDGTFGFGATPDEAVANLWLSLNENGTLHPRKEAQG